MPLPSISERWDGDAFVEKLLAGFSWAALMYTKVNNNSILNSMIETVRRAVRNALRVTLIGLLGTRSCKVLT